MFDIKDNPLYTFDDEMRGPWQQIPVLKTLIIFGAEHWIDFYKEKRFLR